MPRSVTINAICSTRGGLKRWDLAPLVAPEPLGLCLLPDTLILLLVALRGSLGEPLAVLSLRGAVWDTLGVALLPCSSL